MSEYVIMSDSCCDLPADFAKALNIDTVPLIVNLNNVEYKNYLDEREITLSAFYKGLRKGYTAFTSAANADMFITQMTPYLENGQDIVYIGLSSLLSVTYQNACMAAEELKENYPDRTIVCIDSRCASLGQGLLLCLAAKEKASGKNLEELTAHVQETIPHICHWFTVDDLHFLKRGGRISSATASFGSILHIKPILRLNDEGGIVSADKARGRGTSIKALYQKLTESAMDISGQTVMICHADCSEDADYLANKIKNALNPADIIISPIGPVIGAHAGPGAIAVFFIGDKR